VPTPGDGRRYHSTAPYSGMGFDFLLRSYWLLEYLEQLTPRHAAWVSEQAIKVLSTKAPLATVYTGKTRAADRPS
jgi:hypothetical protein